MGRAAIVGAIVLLVVSVGTYFLLGASFAEDAEHALALRADGEAVTAHVTARQEITRQSGAGSSRRIDVTHVLDLSATRADGSAWQARMDVTQAEYESHPEGSTLEVTLLRSDPASFMDTAELASRDASGHLPDEGSTRPLLAGAAGGMFGLVTFAITWGRARRRA